jgi:hypothetical protein
MRTIWAILLIAFVALNLYALISAGVGALISYPTALPAWGVVATVDLVLALCVGIYWTALDARSRGVSALPFIILTLLTGSVGLLAYLVEFCHPEEERRRIRKPGVIDTGVADPSLRSG